MMPNLSTYFAAQVTPDHRYLYVSDLPRHGGKDFGYCFDVTKALRLTHVQLVRFRNYADYCGFKIASGQW